MAKREMSSTLKNLKFMQRATQREEIAKKLVEEEEIPDGNFLSSNIPRKWLGGDCCRTCREFITEAKTEEALISSRKKTMGFSSWLYTNSTKQVLKIVHPGGHAELHDRPVLASEIINRNPRCCVAQPNIFQQPWAIVAPDTTLMPGQKFYVVPVSTIRRLQKLSLKHNTFQNQDVDQNNHGFIANGEGESFRTTCWQSEHSNSSKGVTSNDSYCACLRSGKKMKGNNDEAESSKERLASNLTYSEKNAESKKRSNDICIRGGPPKRLIALDNWHPGLESIGEEIASA